MARSRRWERAIKDTSGLSFKGDVAPGFAGGAFLFLWLWITGKSGFQVMRELIIPFAGASLVMFGLWAAHFGWNFWRAKERLAFDDIWAAKEKAEKERDEAIAALKTIPGATQELPKIADVRVHISYSSHVFGIGGQEGFDHPKLRSGALLIKIYGDVLVDGMTTLESTALQIAGDNVPAVAYKSDFVHAGVTWGLAEYFEIPASIGSGEHFARLLAFAEGMWWASKEQFSVIIPPRQECHT